MNLKEVVGINLKYYRYKSGLSQEKYYTSLGLNHKYLANLERGIANISFDYLEELAIKMGVEINDLILYDKNHVIKKKRIDEKVKN